MANQINLLLGVHNHQPVDNWDHVIEDAYVKCYKPFLDVLESHPKVGMSIHYTGYLLDWLFENHPDLIDQLKRLIQRGQVEMFGGAYYEPIIAIIPDADKVGQIEKLSDRVEALTGQRPHGMWLAERVWEPHLVKPIAQADIRYLFLDDSHFKAAGLDDNELHGRYTSEEQGFTTNIFPVDKTLRYQIPYAQPQEIIDYLGSIASEDGNRAAIYFDDGEKFGVWPGSYGLVFREKWLDRFFTALESNANFINTITPMQYVAKTNPIGRIYLPTASYSEMMEWALPAKHINTYEQGLKEVPAQFSRFLRGGFWRNFLVKYPEANNIHKKMLYVSEKIHKLEQKKGIKSQEALDELWKGQSNDIFWHGVFGGLYLTNLRTANYQHLLRAENIVDTLMHGQSFFNVVQRDLDCDGHTDLLIETSAQNLYLDPHEGGCLFELDYRAKNFNLLDTLARRYESYHDKLSQAVHSDSADDSGTASIHDRVVSKERNLDQHLHYDWHRRVSLLDHFLGADTNLDSLAQSRYPEQGDFVNQPYKATTSGQSVTLTRQGTVWTSDKAIPIKVEKQLNFVDPDQAQTMIRYTITNLSKETVHLWFAPEFNVNLLAGDAPDRYYYLPEPEPSASKPVKGVAVAEAVETKAKLRSKKLISKEALQSVYGIGLRDEWMGIDYHLVWNRLGNVWRFPVETVSQSEAGFEKVYQSSAIFPNWKIDLGPHDHWEIEITQRIASPRI
jgi:alpha-amylase